MVVLGQIAGLGIRDKLARYLTWLGTSLAASSLAVVSLAAAAIPYALLAGFALWRLTEPR